MLTAPCRTPLVLWGAARVGLGRHDDALPPRPSANPIPSGVPLSPFLLELALALYLPLRVVEPAHDRFGFVRRRHRTSRTIRRRDDLNLMPGVARFVRGTGIGGHRVVGGGRDPVATRAFSGGKFIGHAVKGRKGTRDLGGWTSRAFAHVPGVLAAGGVICGSRSNRDEHAGHDPVARQSWGNGAPC